MRKKDLRNKQVVESRIDRAKNALELSKELFMLTGEINYYNLYKAIENPEKDDWNNILHTIKIWQI